MQFSRLDSEIALAMREATRLTTMDAMLAHFVTGYLVVDIVSEFEVRLEEMFCLRATKLGDAPTANFVSRMMDKKFRSPDLKKIHDFLKWHDVGMYDTFYQHPDRAAWESGMGNLMTNRHCFVHKNGNPTMTISDVDVSYRKAILFFDPLAAVLGLTTTDCSRWS